LRGGKKDFRDARKEKESLSEGGRRVRAPRCFKKSAYL